MASGARRAAAALVTLVALLAPAAPAGADPARPTNDRSTVLTSRPPLPSGVEVRVVGGDAFLEVEVARGHRVVVPDYGTTAAVSTTPYLRFQADGTVQRNANAVATAANRSRYGTADRAPDPDAPVRWETVAHHGRYAWHDHRIHWMSPVPPRAVSPTGRIDLGGPNGTWEVPLVVDGRATTVVGELVQLPAPSPLPWLVLALVLAGAVVALAARGEGGHRPIAGLAVLTAGAAIVAGWSEWSGAPAGAGATPVVVVIPAVALAAAVAALVGPPRWRLASWAAAAAALLGWGILRVGVLTHAVLPTTGSEGFDRAATAAAIGVGLGLAGALVWRPPGRLRRARKSAGSLHAA